MIAGIPLTISEKTFQDLVIKQAILHGWTYAHFLPAQRGNRWLTAMEGHTGFPDLVLARDWEVLMPELKAQQGRVSPGQRHWLTQLGSHGRLWKPSDWNTICKELAS